jgi:DNA-binding GntR family transcriptional regulator
VNQSRGTAGAIGQRSVQPRRLLRQDVFEILLQEFINGQFVPGDRIRDDEIAQRLGVSRTPIREALTRLSMAGLVDTAPNRYTRVADLVTEEGIRTLKVLSTLYGLALEQLMRTLEADDLYDLEILVRRIDSTPDVEAFDALDAIQSYCITRLDFPALELMISIAQPRVLRILRQMPHILAKAGDVDCLRAFIVDLLAMNKESCARKLHMFFASIESATRSLRPATSERAAVGGLSRG